jgi:sugar phosphate isomerase/epimerase
MAISAPAFLSSAAESARSPIAFSTLGCPAWSWNSVLSRATEWGYAAIELRGLQGEMDLTKRSEFTGDRLAGTLKELQTAGLRISDLGSSVRLHEENFAPQLDEGRRYIDLAHRLKAPFIRVFGDRVLPGKSKKATVDRIISGLRELGEYANGSGVGVLIESHGDFCDSPTLLEILTGADRPNVALLWDAHHTVVAGKEAPADTWRQVGRYVRHVHLKDSKPEGKEVRYVLTGAGNVPVRETVQLLAKQHYQGYYCLEWEKVWHPEIQEPEIVFPHFAKVVREYLSS